MLQRLGLAALLLLLPALALAEDDDPAGRVLSSLERKDARLLGRSWFGIHAGRKNLGALEVEIAPTTSGTASWHACARAQVLEEDERQEREEEGLLDRRLAPERLEERERAAPASAKQERPALVRAVARDPEGFRVALAGKSELVRPAHPLVHGVAARLAFLRAIDARAQATYALSDLDPETGAPREVLLVAAGRPVPGERPLFPVDAKVGAKGEAWRFLLDPDAPPERRVVRFSRTDREGADYVLARDAASARRDLPPGAPPAPGTACAAVLEYLLAVEKRDAKRLEAILDWPALHARLADPGEKLDEWKKTFLAHFADAGDDDDDHHGKRASAEDLQGKLILESLSTDGREARVRIEGERGTFRVQRVKDGPWKVAELP